MKTKDMVLIGMFAAVLAVISQISLPMPSGVPITIQLFGIALVGAVLGSKRGFLSTFIYILLGTVGLPVFANFRGGLSVLLGTTGGYIVAWLIMVFLCGIRPKTANKFVNYAIMIVLTVAGVLIVEFIGGLWWWYLVNGTENAHTYGWIIAYSFTAFIPKDIIISIIALFIGTQMRKPLISAGFLTAEGNAGD